MKTLVLSLFSTILVASCGATYKPVENSRKTLERVNDVALFHIFADLYPKHIENIDTDSDYYAKIVRFASDVQVPNTEACEMKEYFYFVIADYSDYHEGTLFKTRPLIRPKYKVKHLGDNKFELSLTFFDEAKNSRVTEKFICISRMGRTRGKKTKVTTLL